jgi:hypothetical protein
MRTDLALTVLELAQVRPSDAISFCYVMLCVVRAVNKFVLMFLYNERLTNGNQ